MKKNLLLLLSLVTFLLISSLAFSQERKGEKIKVSKSAVVEFSTMEGYSRQHPDDPNQKRIGGTIAGEGEGDEEGEMPKMKIPKNAKVTSDPFGKMPVPTLQKPSPGTNSQTSFSPIIDFNGIDDINSTIPPDVGGQIGPNHVMTTLNSFVRISSRTGSVISTVTLNAFFSSVGNPSTFDPKVLYDPYNNRWIITACGNAQSASSALLVGVSQTNDPTGAWNLYSIDVDAANTNWFDYPSIGFNKDWVVIGGNMFTNSGNSFTGGKLFVLKKVDLYAALASPAVTVINAGSNGFTLVPAVTYDNSISTIYLTQNFNGNSGGNGFIGFYTITGAVGSEVLSSATMVSTPNPWNDVANVTNFAPQAGTASKVACNDARMQKTIYRNGSIWCTHSVFLPVGTPTRSAVQWWQFNTSAGILQRGRIDDATATNFYVFPSIDVNKNDDAMIGCAKFSAGIFPSATYAIRMASDPVNTFQSDFVYKAGLAKYFKTFGGTSNRWGDYTSVSVDPINDLNFWTVQEYAMLPSGGNDLWGTWWAGVSVSPPTPDIRFQQSDDTKSETTVSTTGCRGYKDYTYNMVIANAPTGTATVNLVLSTIGNTATQNVDYELLNTILTFPDGSNASQPFTVRIYDDAAKETTETFALNYTISGTTDAQAGTFNQMFTFTIADNDAAPIASGNFSGTIGTANGNFNMPFRASHFDARTQMLYSAAELSALGFSAGNITSVGFNVTTKASTQPFNGFTIRLKNTATSVLGSGPFETGGTQVFNANYSTVAGQNNIPITPFAWDGTSNLLVDVCFDNSTATFSDLVAGTTANTNCIYDRQNTNATPGCSIANVAFGLNFRPLITLIGNVIGTPVSTVLNNTKTAYLGPNDDVYFYDGAGAIMARIKNNTAFDYGCTEVTIDRDGTSSAQFWNSNTPNYLASKSIKVVPTNNTSAGNYDISLYYTGSEVSGFEADATPTTFNSSKVVKVSNGFFVPDVTATTTHANDVKIVSGTATSLGANTVMTGNFASTGFSGFGVGDPGCMSLTAQTPTICDNVTSVDLTALETAIGATGGTWKDGSSNAVATPTAADPTIGPFTYTVNGNCSTTVTYSFNTSVGISSVSADANPICAGTTTNVNANGVVGTNAVVNWYDSLGNSLGSGLTLSNVGPGIRYIAKVTGTCGSPAEASLKVIGDTVNPTISCPSNIMANSSATACSKPVVTPNPTYSDNCTVNLLSWTFSGATTASSPAGGIRLVGTKIFNVGTTTVTYTVTDNTARTNTCSFDVKVVDVSKPTFTATNTNVVENVVSGCTKSIAISNVSFTDACGTPSLSWVMTGATTGSGSGQVGTALFNVGVTKITYTLKDASGNTATSSFTVEVKENIAPTISCPANITLSTVGTNCTRYASVAAPTYADNCGVTTLTWAMTGATVLSSPSTGIKVVGGKLFNAGLTTVTYTAKDRSGNPKSCSLNVQINTTNSCPSTTIAKGHVENQEIISSLKAKLLPNPTTKSFNLRVQSDSKEELTIVVYNNEGKQIQQFKGAVSQNIIFGAKYVSGIYMIEVVQGEKRTTVTGVKQ